MRDDEKLVSEQEGKLQTEANFAIAEIHGIAILLTFLLKGEYLNDLLSTLATEAADILDNDVLGSEYNW